MLCKEITRVRGLMESREAQFDALPTGCSSARSQFGLSRATVIKIDWGR